MARLVALVVALVLAAPDAWADAGAKVVLADPDPELRGAMERSLAPWRLEVIVDKAPPRDLANAKLRAEAVAARFIVWRDGAELVVYDRERASLDRRDSRAGALDPPAAAAAALTIKTMMRLPPPEPAAPPAAPAVAVSVAVPPADPVDRIRVQAGVASRIAGEVGAGLRVAGSVAVRPWRSSPWRLAVAADAGTTAEVSRAGFRGTWSDWSIYALASWSWAPSARWEIEPFAGGGFRQSHLDGTEMSAARTESATLGAARGGVWARLRLGPAALAAGVAGDAVFGTPTYTKSGAAAEIFAVPASAIEVCAAISIML